jgi:hypothetical protein
MDIRAFWICFDSAGARRRTGRGICTPASGALETRKGGLRNGRRRAGLRSRKTAELPGNGEVKRVSRDPSWDLGCSG